MNDTRVCSVEACGNPAKLRKRCQKHYRTAMACGEIARVRTKCGVGLEFIHQALLTETSDCIIWPFGKNRDGYPIIKVNGITAQGHRYVCAQAHGEPSKALLALHSCHTPSCVNKKHLRWGTQMDNIRDRKSSPRRPVGIRGPSVRLTEAQVKLIRTTYPQKSLQEYADMFGVRRSTIHRIIHRRTWAHL